jgi:glyoxylase-like metal-dependent hydrolase (beta-lactamase superfamily II)
MALGYAERNRFGRVGRIPTPTPLGVGDINSYLLFPPDGLAGSVRDGGGVTLVDTGVRTQEAFDALQRGLKEFGVPFRAIERILITHAHMDHFGQAKRLRDLSGARVYASRTEAALMRTHFSPSGDRRELVLESFRRWGVPAGLLERQTQMADLARRIQEPIEVDGFLGGGDVLAIGDLHLEVIETPGHCDGHVVFWEPELRLLFSGDHLLTNISPVPLLVFPEDPSLPRPKSLVRFMRSLEEVEKLPCELVFPAHGDVIRDHRKLIAGYRLHHERRKLQMLRLLRERPATAWELAGGIFPKVRETQVYLVMSEVIGHLDLLLDEGTVVVEERDRVEIARAV